jgi:hypothetical protein
LFSGGPSSSHIDNAADALATLRGIKYLPFSQELAITYMHVMESLVDFSKGSVVGNVFVDSQLAIEII